MKTILLLLSCFLLASCSGSKFYRQISNRQFYDNKYFDEKNKDIFEKFEALETNSLHIVYLYIPGGHISNLEYSGLIYDVDNANYSITNVTGKAKDLIMESITFDSFDYRHYLISKYLNGEVNYLIWLGKVGISSRGLAETTLYDIDLRKHKTLKYSFSEILMEDDMPFYETEIGKQLLISNGVPLYKE